MSAYIRKQNQNIAARAAFAVILLKTRYITVAMFVQNHAASVPQVCRKCAAAMNGLLAEYQSIR